MKVLHLSTFHLSGGAGVAASRLNQALRRAGVDSSVLVDHPSRPENHVFTFNGSYWGRKLTWARFSLERLYFLQFEKNKSVRFAFSPARIGANIADHPLVKQADIIHLHWVNFGFISIEGIGKLLATGKPIVWTFHDMWPMTGGCHHSGSCDHYQNTCGNCKFLSKEAPNDLSNRVWARKLEAFSKQRFSPVTCSEWLGNRAGQSSLLKNLPIRSIPNPIDTEVFKPDNKREARRKLGLDPEKHFLLFAAAKVKAAGKGYELFQDAIHTIAARHPDFAQNLELILFGQADSGLADDFPLKINFLGYLSNTRAIADAYCAASAFVTPSLEENLPNTIMEAMACGTPCVGFEVGGIPEMIDHLQNGFVAEYKSVVSLAEGIKWVLEHNTDNSLSTAARNKVMNCYTESIVAEKYKEVYKTLLPY